MNHLLTLLISTALLATTSCKKDTTPLGSKAELDQWLEEELDLQYIPAMAVLAFDDAEILYENYLGQSTRETGLPLEGDHLFLLASISKTITATALLQQYDQGKFQLDDPINNHLPFRVEVPGQSTPITFRMLLTHTSGIADGAAMDAEYYNGQDSPKALDAWLESYLVPGGSNYNATDNYYSFQPGTQHEYSNAGSALIGVLVEQLSGMDFNSYCKQHIFQPLGMNNTHWRLDEITETIAVPYDYINRNWETHQHYTFTDYPNGGLRSTARDMHRFVQMMAANGSFQGQHILKAATVQAMLSPQIPSIDNQVGLHLFVMNSTEGLWGHDGGEKGTSTIMAWNPATGKGAIVLCNQGEADLDPVLTEVYRFIR